MSNIITYVIAACVAIYALVLVGDLTRTRPAKRVLLEGFALLVVVVVLYVATGFPMPSGRQAFGGLGPLPAIGLMFVCVLLGMAAQYVFYLRGPFSWLSFAKPLCVSPIVLLPLLGTLEGVSRVESIQLISFCVLAFQNGFFWMVVFERAKTET